MISKNTLELLEFHKLLRLISDFANSEASGRDVLDIRPFTDKADIEQRQGQIEDIRRMANKGTPVRLSSFSDISHLFLKIKPEGAVLEAIELAEFIPFLGIAYDISVQLEEINDLPFLKELAGHLTGFPEILRILRKSVDSEGNILDSASFLLADLRARIRNLEGKIRKRLEEMVRDERLSVFLQDDFVTTRSGRWVIPVRMDSKGMVPGVVHDVSKSGDTAFIEPLGIINLANELENVVAEQKAEEIRILRNICSQMRTVVDDIREEFETIVYLDVLNCIAKFADLLKMEPPVISNSASISLLNSRHPLLQLSLRKTPGSQRIIPLNVQLGSDKTVMVITGANAGGKTIAIKTVGLLLLMALSGMPVPADSSSRFPLIRNLLVDMGDEQSIEDNLSTFSAHISNISEIIKMTDSETLVLIDELGTGTDPEEGAALACAILKDILRSGALVFATTHLADIKGFVHRTEGMVNASMEFDQKTLTPLYRLRVGEPGQSHALEIAKRYGLPDRLINDARGMLGSVKVEFDRMIADMNEKRFQYEQALNELQKNHSEIEEKNRLLSQKLREAEDSRKEMLAKAYREASDIISDTKRRMNFLLDEMKKKSRDEGRRIKKEVESSHEYVTEKIREFDSEDLGAPSIDEIRKGDTIFVRSLGCDASVSEVNKKNNRIKLLAKNMEIEVPFSDIGYKRGKSVPLHTASFKTSEDTETVPSRMNLVGLRVDEALSSLEKLLNHASLAEMRELTIIHGIGKGLLLKAIHEHLNNHPLVKHFRSGTAEEGGIGVTIVTMK